MKKLQFLIIGAHPDDPDSCGGLAQLMRQKGHEVTLLSLTDGSAGHHEMGRKELAERRREEARQAGLVLDCPYIVASVPDGELIPSLENRALLMKYIRQINPDVIITHRTCDYHPDHRSTAQLVMDCSYLLGVPLYCPDIPAMRKTPVILSMHDEFTRPLPFSPDVVLPIDGVIENCLQALLKHVSQYYEWLPWCDHWDDVTAAVTMEEKTKVLLKRAEGWFSTIADKYAHLLPEGTRYAEAYEWNEYGAPLTDELIREMTESATIK